MVSEAMDFTGEKLKQDKEYDGLKDKFNDKEMSAIHGEAVRIAQARYPKYNCLPGKWIISIEKELMEGRLARSKSDDDMPTPKALEDKQPRDVSSVVPVKEEEPEPAPKVKLKKSKK